MARTNSRYGWIPDLPDQRDYHFAAPSAVQASLPPAVDLTPLCPPVYDQGQLGSCTGNGVAGVLQFDAMKESLPDTSTPSRLFIYYNERVIEGTVKSDSGAQIRDGIKTVAATGACDETLWPYDITMFAHKPTATTQWPPSTLSPAAGMGTTPVLATSALSKLSYTVKPKTIGYPEARHPLNWLNDCPTLEHTMARWSVAAL